MRRTEALILLALAACSLEPEPLPPFGEALVVVDTDLPVPRVVSRLRVDLQGEDGVVFATRDDVRPDVRDWPTSFSVFTDDTARGRTVVVRMRAYLEARTATDGSGEPDPALAVDRAVRVRLEPGRRGRVRITLRGACAGKTATLAPLEEARSCIDEAQPDAPIADAVLEDTLSREVPSEVGAFGRITCDGVEAKDDRACIPGGTFVLGDRFYRPDGESAGLAARPERVITLSRFLVDRDEVSVARYRAALARGFVPPLAPGVKEVDGPPGIGKAADDACTFSAAPRGREDYPLSCVAWVTADAFCRAEGGSLPTEAQWEYAALAAGRTRKAAFAWGDEPPSCERATHGRTYLTPSCVEQGEGPQPLRSAPGDVTALGVHDLGGGLEEHVLDSFDAFSAPCWASAPALDPVCKLTVPSACVKDPTSQECRLPGGFQHGLRGGSWGSFSDSLRGIIRASAQGATMLSIVGFRCVYPAP